MAVIGPDSKGIGEVKDQGQLYQNQIAKTLAAFVGKEFKPDAGVGEVISTMLSSAKK
jgi:hypothetical protein